jgi:carbamoyltransferase
MHSTVLGISAFYHDSAAAIVRDGEILAAAQEERFSRRKNDPSFPHRAINYCLEEAFIEPSELDAIVFYDDPLLTWDRALRGCAAAGEAGAEQFVHAARSLLGTKLWVRDHVERALGSLGRRGDLLVTEHHVAHAASAFYPSPFRDAAIITLDGVGEWATTTVGTGSGTSIELTREIRYPDSLGLLYSAFTYFCGFKVNSGEYKLMGLAPYGRPVYRDRILDRLIDLRPDGSYRLNPEYLGYLSGLTMTNDAFHDLFGGPPRRPADRITRREMDLAASIQSVLEEAVLRIARFARRETGMPNLVMAGGVALNCVANGLILREGIFDEIWIQPAAGDAGGALGAALHVAHHDLGAPRHARPGDGQKNSLLGPRYSTAEIQAFIGRHGYLHTRVPDPTERASRVADALARGSVVGFFSGRMEFGPRALGARSILGNPLLDDTQSRMNLKIKFRESFRPFAPAVLREEVDRYFELDRESPYMLLVAPVRAERRLPAEERPQGEDMLAIVNQRRSDLPAITHVDFSARIQTVSADEQPEFHRVISAFRDRTGYPVLVNTSFNVRGEPIVQSPDEAYRCFMNTGIDLLVLEDFLLWKEEQPPATRAELPDEDAEPAAAPADPARAAADLRLQRFFREHVLPRVAHDRSPQVTGPSYYLDRAQPAPATVVLAPWLEPGELAAALISRHAPEDSGAAPFGLPHHLFIALAEDIARLAFELRTDEAQPASVDAFLYAMF